jgi:nucleoside-triphosphatase THEP1
VTGGPCAGKTTALSTINSYLSSRGYKVYIVPEAATLLMKSGFSIDANTFTDLDAIYFQAHLMRTQIALEDIFMSYA